MQDMVQPFLQPWYIILPKSNKFRAISMAIVLANQGHSSCLGGGHRGAERPGKKKQN